MKTKRNNLTAKVSFGIPPHLAQLIADSGDSAGEWFRQAAQERLDREQRRETPYDRLTKALEHLFEQSERSERAQARDYEALARLQAQLQGVQTRLAAVEQAQSGLREAIVAQGPKLLQGLKDLLSTSAQVQRPNLKHLGIDIDNVPERTRL